MFTRTCLHKPCGHRVFWLYWQISINRHNVFFQFCHRVQCWKYIQQCWFCLYKLWANLTIVIIVIFKWILMLFDVNSIFIRVVCINAINYLWKTCKTTIIFYFIMFPYVLSLGSFIIACILWVYILLFLICFFIYYFTMLAILLFLNHIFLTIVITFLLLNFHFTGILIFISVNS
jgi:hypothetical protein